MQTRTELVLGEIDLAELKQALVRLRVENEADVAQARITLNALTSDNSIGSALLQQTAENAEYMIADALGIIALVDAAFDRMEIGNYGTCTVCREPIPLERLQLRPYGMTCVPCNS
ncbi:MAG: TraR/DksA C4-type zinc finger protein [Actinomycetota bacterium]|nr:TraR/DksA C4-type zinc finger protein [Actinomycetota bacterium]